jgi:hypothetical protein
MSAYPMGHNRPSCGQCPDSRTVNRPSVRVSTRIDGRTVGTDERLARGWHTGAAIVRDQDPAVVRHGSGGLVVDRAVRTHPTFIRRHSKEACQGGEYLPKCATTNVFVLRDLL